MSPFEMVVAIVAIGCTTAVIGHALDVAKAYVIARGRSAREEPALQEALRQLREEMAQMRHATNDAVLSFDGTLQRLEARLQHVEQRALGAGAAAATPARDPQRSTAIGEQKAVAGR